MHLNLCSRYDKQDKGISAVRGQCCSPAKQFLLLYKHLKNFNVALRALLVRLSRFETLAPPWDINRRVHSYGTFRGT